MDGTTFRYMAQLYTTTTYCNTYILSTTAHYVFSQTKVSGKLINSSGYIAPKPIPLFGIDLKLSLMVLILEETSCSIFNSTGYKVVNQPTVDLWSIFSFKSSLPCPSKVMNWFFKLFKISSKCVQMNNEQYQDTLTC